MAATAQQVHRPVAPPTAGPRLPLPDGAVKMQPWYIDDSGVRRKMPYPVPVDADDHRTTHVRYQCPHRKVVNGGGREQCGEFEWLLPGSRAPFCREHGEQLTPPVERERAVTVVKETARMYGRSAAPWLLPVAELAADAAAGIAGVSGPVLLLSAPLLAGGSYYLTRRTLTARAVKRGKIERGQRTGRRIAGIDRRAQRAAAVAGEAGVWAAGLAATDMSTWAGRIVMTAGAVRWAVGSYRWWATAEQRRARTMTTLEPVPSAAVAEEQATVTPPDPLYLRAVTTWANLIGSQGGPLPGTELVDFKRLPNCEVGASIRTRLPNWQATVVAKIPGSINMREIRPTLLGRIAAAYGCSYADVSFAADEDNLAVAYVRVQPDNLLAETRMWPGPAVANEWKRGRSRIGRYDDGADIIYQWWTSTGAVHDLISGCTGSGKSELVAQLLLAGLHSDGLVLDWVGDPQGGQSYGVLRDAVDWFARDKGEITFMLLAALKEMYRRNDELANSHTKTWKPTKGMPLLVLTLDEVQSYIDDPAILELVEKLVGQGRKCGIKLRLITQVPAAYNLGGSTYIKEQLKSGQTMVFRAVTDTAGRLAVDGDCPVDPTLLPKRWGKNTCAAGETSAGLMFVQGINARDVYGRADYTGEDMTVWLYDVHGESTLSPGSFSRDAQLVSGPLWGDRKERAALRLATGRSDEDLLRGGKAIELIEAAAVTRAVPPQQRPAPAAETLVESRPQAPRARDLVLDAARAAANSSGLVTRDEIIAATKTVKDSTRDRALTDLVGDGSLRRVRNGLYEVTR